MCVCVLAINSISRERTKGRQAKARSHVACGRGDFMSRFLSLATATKLIIEENFVTFTSSPAHTHGGV